MSFKDTPQAHGILVAGLGVLILSFDALLVRLAATEAWNVVFWRGWLVLLSMGAVLWFRKGPAYRPQSRGEGVAAVAGVLIFGVSSGLFVHSVSATKVANTVVILAVSPVFTALFSLFFGVERIRPRTWVTIVVCSGGVALVFGGSLASGYWLGDLYALIIALLMGVALNLMRRYPNISRVAVVAGSGAVAGLLAWPEAQPLSLTGTSYGWLALMGLLQMPLSTVLILSATRYLPSPEVSLFLLLETLFGPLWVWWVLGERIPSATLLGGGVILVTIALHSCLVLREENEIKKLKSKIIDAQ